MSVQESPTVCRHCGKLFRPLQLPAHDCAGVRADRQAAESALMKPGDRVEWKERRDLKAGLGSVPVCVNGVITRIIGGEVLIRVGNTLVQKNLARVRRVAVGKTSHQPSAEI